MRTIFVLLALACTSQAGWLFREPTPQYLTTPALALIVNYEVGGKAQYLRWPHPEWPKGQSGVTWGIGFDGGYESKATILSAWTGVNGVDRLATASGVKGASAGTLARKLADIYVSWDMSLDVFQRIDTPRYVNQCKRAFPGFDDLRPNARSAIVSLVYNRGPSTIGPNRRHMRRLVDLIPKRDYEGMAQAELDMIPLWAGTEIYNGMKARRTAEAKLILTP